MRTPKTSLTTHSVVAVLVLSVTWMAAVQPRAEAMLMPAEVSRPAGTHSRSTDLQTIQTTLESKAIHSRLHAMGLSDAEIQARLSRLSDAQVHQMASQIRAVHPAGDDLIIGVLVVVLLVLLIIYLVKRI